MPRENEFDASAVAAEIIAGIRGLPNRKTATVRALRRRHSKPLANADPRFVVQIALTLLKETDFLFRFVAYELITYHRGALRSLTTKDLERLGRGIAKTFDKRAPGQDRSHDALPQWSFRG